MLFYFLENPEQRKKFIGKFATPAELTEYYTVCPLPVKPLVLYHIIKQNQWNRILCFADSVSSVHKLKFLLQQLNSSEDDTHPMNVVEISSKLKAKVHHEILEKFSAGGIDVLVYFRFLHSIIRIVVHIHISIFCFLYRLVTTDALARGIDLQNVQYVVLYDTPKFPKNYIHRIGRTGRAGQKGTSLVLVTPEQVNNFFSFLNFTHNSISFYFVVRLSDPRRKNKSVKQFSFVENVICFTSGIVFMTSIGIMQQALIISEIIPSFNRKYCIFNRRICREIFYTNYEVVLSITYVVG